jgi:hypothetical protein
LLDQKEHYGHAHKNGNTKQINRDNLNLFLWKQYEKIINFSSKNVGEYKLQPFYGLLCLIKNVTPLNEKNEEMLKTNIEELISLSF